MKREWFAPKRYGYGAGLPIAWQGWAVLLGLFLSCALAIAFVPRFCVTAGQAHDATVLACAILAMIFCLIAANTTRGGWRWRWGEDE